MSQEKELSSEDINKIIETQNSVNRYETIKIFGKNIDLGRWSEMSPTNGTTKKNKQH